MSDISIQGMDFKQLRNEVQLLRDELAITKRKYEDLLYNLDDDNFADYIKKEKENMKTEIKVSAEGIQVLVSEVYPNGIENESSIEVNAREISYKVSAIDVDNKLVNYSTITQTATAITSAVNAERQYTTNLLDTDYYTKVQTNSQITQTADSITSAVSATYETKTNAGTNYTTLNSSIDIEKNRISSIISGTYTDDILNNYLTGIEITPNNIKMIDGSRYSIVNKSGLKFYDSANQVEGWSIEPDEYYGGELNYYVNNGKSYTFGSGVVGTGYSGTDMVLKALNGQRGRFVVDVTNSGYKEVMFVGLSQSGYSPYIYANGYLLATQDWVNNSASATAKFG